MSRPEFELLPFNTNNASPAQRRHTGFLRNPSYVGIHQTWSPNCPQVGIVQILQNIHRSRKLLGRSLDTIYGVSPGFIPPPTRPDTRVRSPETQKTDTQFYKWVSWLISKSILLSKEHVNVSGVPSPQKQSPSFSIAYCLWEHADNTRKRKNPRILSIPYIKWLWFLTPTLAPAHNSGFIVS